MAPISGKSFIGVAPAFIAFGSIYFSRIAYPVSENDFQNRPYWPTHWPQWVFVSGQWETRFQ